MSKRAPVKTDVGILDATRMPLNKAKLEQGFDGAVSSELRVTVTIEFLRESPYPQNDISRIS
jgi:hypothetical protein